MAHKGKKEKHHAYHDEGGHGHRMGHDVSGHKGKSGDRGGKEKGKTSGGPLIHSDMCAYPGGQGCADHGAHPSHHEANKAYGFHEGSSPKGEGSNGEGGSSEGGEGIAGNATYE